MTTQLWIALLLLAVFLIYVAAKIIVAMRESEQKWREVDKSKLREWEDGDEW